jgi:hypothetical protein
VTFVVPFPAQALNVSYSKTGGNGTELVENTIGFSNLSQTGMTVSAKRISGAQTGGEKVIVHYRVLGS